MQVFTVYPKKDQKTLRIKYNFSVKYKLNANYC